MQCPFCCCSNTQVRDSRETSDHTAIRRRRVCFSCHARFTTYERVQLRDLVVIKNNGKKESFSRDKLSASFSIALRKRPVEEDKVERAISDIIRMFEKSGEYEIFTYQIGKSVMDALKKLDHVAYLRYASVYRDFQEIQDFSDFINQEV